MCDPTLNFVASILILVETKLRSLLVYFISILLLCAFVWLLQKAFSRVKLIASEVLWNLSVRFLKYALTFYRFASMQIRMLLYLKSIILVFLLLFTYMFLQNSGACLQPHFFCKKNTYTQSVYTLFIFILSLYSSVLNISLFILSLFIFILSTSLRIFWQSFVTYFVLY